MEKLKRFKKPLVVLSLALVLAFVWMTGASTYAKYITSKTITPQSATVAKWGFIVDANTEKLFGNQYELKTGETLSTVVGESATTDATINVKASSTGNVVAPGTTGSMTFTIGGSAEVLSNITVTATGTDISLTKGKATYNPIKWTLSWNDTWTSTGTTTPKSVTGTLAEIVRLITTGTNTIGGTSYTLGYYNGDSNVINPNTTIPNATYTLSWAWAFETYEGDDRLPTGFGISVDEADTILGVAAVDGNYANGAFTIKLPGTETLDPYYVGYQANTTVSFDLTITVEQIPKAA